MQVDSGYGSPSTGPRSNAKIDGLYWFEKEPSRELWTRSQDIETRLREPLRAYLKRRNKAFNITFRLMALGHDHSSAKFCIVIFCPEESFKKTKKFVRKRNAVRTIRSNSPDQITLDVTVFSGCLRATSGVYSIPIHGTSCEKFGCTPIYCQNGDDSYSGTMGGSVCIVDGNGHKSIYGLTSNHIFNGLWPPNSDSDSDSDAMSSDESSSDSDSTCSEIQMTSIKRKFSSQDQVTTSDEENTDMVDEPRQTRQYKTMDEPATISTMTMEKYQSSAADSGYQTGCQPSSVYGTTRTIQASTQEESHRPSKRCRMSDVAASTDNLDFEEYYTGDYTSGLDTLRPDITLGIVSEPVACIDLSCTSDDHNDIAGTSAREEPVETQPYLGHILSLSSSSRARNRDWALIEYLKQQGPTTNDDHSPRNEYHELDLQLDPTAPPLDVLLVQPNALHGCRLSRLPITTILPFGARYITTYPVSLDDELCMAFCLSHIPRLTLCSTAR